MTTSRPKGYLVFTTHDMDELDATFIPEDVDKELLNALRDMHDTKSMEHARSLFDTWKSEHETQDFFIQARCEQPWPFNNHEIIKTFYLLVY